MGTSLLPKVPCISFIVCIPELSELLLRLSIDIVLVIVFNLGDCWGKFEGTLEGKSGGGMEKRQTNIQT